MGDQFSFGVNEVDTGKNRIIRILHKFLSLIEFIVRRRFVEFKIQLAERQ